MPLVMVDDKNRSAEAVPCSPPLQILVIIKHLQIEIVSKKRPAGRDDLSSIIGLDGEYVAGAFMAVEGFHMHLK